jgi:hypothetical protein
MVVFHAALWLWNVSSPYITINRIQLAASQRNLRFDSLNKTVIPNSGNIFTIAPKTINPAVRFAENPAVRIIIAQIKNTIRSALPLSYNNMDAGENIINNIQIAPVGEILPGNRATPIKNSTIIKTAIQNVSS